MDTENAIAGFTCTADNNKENNASRSMNDMEIAESQLRKTLAQRAIHGSERGRGRFQTGCRKIKHKGEVLPSRLSKVSLADQRNL